MPPGHLTYGVLHMWACHNCGTGGMTTFIESCPECQHRYCSNCIIESATKRVSGYIMKPEDHKPSSGQSGPIYIAASNAPLLDDAQRAEEPFKSASLPWSILNSKESTPLAPETPSLSHKEKTHKVSLPYGDSDAQKNSDSNSLMSSSTSSPSSSSEQPSRSDSETLDSQQEHVDSQTEVESEELGVEAQHFDHVTEVLDSRLMSTLGHDLGLATRVIPQIYAIAYSEYRANITAHTTASPQVGSGSSETQEPANNSSSTRTSTNGNPPLNFQLQKRRRETDEQDGDKGPENHRLKRPKPIAGEKPPTFACHFYKMDPNKYGPWTERKYRTCVAPSVRELRRIKDHFKAAHRPYQCHKCYIIFKEIDELMAHHEPEAEPCHPNSPSLKEGINDSQWRKIEHLCSAKHKKKRSSGKDKHDIETWFEIWRTIFPGTREPAHPWNEPASPSAPLSYDMESLLATFERFVEFDIQQGALRQDDVLHEIYLNAFRQTFQAETAASRGIAASYLPLNFQQNSLTSSKVQQSTESSAGSVIEAFEETTDPSFDLDFDLMGMTSADLSSFDKLLDDFFAEQGLSKSDDEG